MSLPVLVINRDQDTDRLAAFRQSADAHGVGFERVPALDAHAPDFPFADYADLIGDRFWGEPEVKPGAIGCFLSHRKAWQHLLNQGWPMALICEDDAVFYKSPHALIDLIQDSSELDVVFVNQRLASWCAGVTSQPAARLSETVRLLAAAGGPRALGLKPTPGGDCYLLTARGAEQLLARTTAQRITCGVDWAMVWNSLPDVTDTQAVAFPELDILRRVMPAVAKPLTAIVLANAIADQSGAGGSTIQHKIRVPIDRLLER